MTVQQLIDRLQAALRDPSTGVKPDNEVFVGTLGTPDRVVGITMRGFRETSADRAMLVLETEQT